MIDRDDKGEGEIPGLGQLVEGSRHRSDDDRRDEELIAAECRSGLDDSRVLLK